MSTPFSFGFSGDDIGADGDEGDSAVLKNESAPQTNTPPPTKAQSHRIEDLLQTLPSKISYQYITITSPKGKTLQLPRRELFDIKMQLMAEDDNLGDQNQNQNTSSAKEGLESLEDSDILTNVYEGGFKSWECSFDLASLLLDRGPRKDLDDLFRVDHVIEMGCGTAIPSLVLFHHAITESLPIYFTLTDYNASALRVVTLPNLLLTWASTLPSTFAPFSPSSPNPLADKSTINNDLEITPALITHFLSSLKQQSLILNLISGSWSPSSPFLSFIPTAPEMNILVLASETIYSPNALSGFTEALIGILKGVRMGKAMVAAKRVYFGVGGSVDAFKIECRERKAVAYEIENHGVELGESGIRRCLVEVQMY